MAIHTLLTEQEILEAARFQGSKLGLLIAALNVSNETKTALLELLPEMTLEQLERFSLILENEYLNQKTRDLDETLKQKLAEIKTDQRKKMSELDEVTLQAITDLSSKLG